MELFQYKIAFVESNATLASVCNNSRLEGSEFARFVVDEGRMYGGNCLVSEDNIVEIISMIISLH